MFLVSKSQPYGFQCEKTNKKNTTYPAYFSASIFSSWSSKHFFFCLTKKKKKHLLFLVGITFFRVWFFKPLHITVGIIWSLFTKVILVFKILPLWVDVNYLSAQYLKNHFMKHSPTLWLLLRRFLGAQLHLSVVISVFKAHHLGAMWLFVCTISQEPLDEIFSYLVVASSEVSWDAHTGNTPQALTMAWSCPNVPLCGNLGEVEYQIP